MEFIVGRMRYFYIVYEAMESSTTKGNHIIEFLLRDDQFMPLGDAHDALSRIIGYPVIIVYWCEVSREQFINFRAYTGKAQDYLKAELNRLTRPRRPVLQLHQGGEPPSDDEQN